MGRSDTETSLPFPNSAPGEGNLYAANTSASAGDNHLAAAFSGLSFVDGSHSNSSVVKNKVLVLGRDTDAQLKVLKRLFAVVDNATNDGTVEQASPSFILQEIMQKRTSNPDAVEDEPAVIPWTIDTKYYTAKVDFWLDACPTGEPDPSVLQAYNKIGQAFDAFVFVFHKDKPETLEDLNYWTAFVEAHEPSITLCIGTTSDINIGQNFHSSDDIDVNHYNRWCVENGFEYVDIDAKASSNDVDQELVGAQRMLEALKTHMWDGMQRKDCTNGGQGIDQDETFKVAAEGFLDELLNTSVKGLPDPANATLEGLSSVIAEAPEDDDDLMFDSFEGTHSQIFGSFDEDDGYDHAFETIRNLKEQSKTLPDAERRRLAAEVALSFARQLEIT